MKNAIFGNHSIITRAHQIAKKVSVMEEDWDFLIVLDACRYDYFSYLYRNYFCGKLKKIISQGSSTLEWCKNSFQEVYSDVIYISSNPYINSKSEVRGFNARTHFSKVIDVWDWGWNDEFGTVHPKTVNETVQRYKADYSNKRFVIHYLQPHAPYIGYNPYILGFPRPQIGRSAPSPLEGVQKKRNHGVFEVNLVKLLAILTKPAELFTGNPLWKICGLLNLPPLSPMDDIRRQFGDAGLRRAYMQNLRYVLEYVTMLIDDLSGIIVITADHGERLGERGKYSHVGGCRDSLLLEVPWCIVKKATKRKCHQTKEKNHASTRKNLQKLEKEDEDKIRKRLRKLGYI